MNQTSKIIIAIIITTIVVGGGVYYWQENKSQPLSNSATQSSSPDIVSLDDYMNTYEKFPITMPQNQVKQLVKVFSLGNEKCTEDLDSEFCSPDLIEDGAYLGRFSLLSDAGWSDAKDHEFYFEFGSEGGALYYGPFKDNVLRLEREASQKENFLSDHNLW